MSEYKFDPDELRTITSITGSYAKIGGDISRRVIAAFITHNLNGDAYLSFDGVTNHVYIPQAVQSLSIEMAAFGSYLVKGGAVYLKDGPTASTSGQLCVTLVFGG